MNTRLAAYIFVEYVYMCLKIRTCTELISHGQFKCCRRPAHLVVKYYNENGSWDGEKVFDTLKMGEAGNWTLWWQRWIKRKNFAVIKSWWKSSVQNCLYLFVYFCREDLPKQIPLWTWMDMLNRRTIASQIWRYIWDIYEIYMRCIWDELETSSPKSEPE